MENKGKAYTHMENKGKAYTRNLPTAFVVNSYASNLQTGVK